MNYNPLVGMIAVLALSTGLILSALAEQPASFKKSTCTNMSKACIIEVARTYINGRTDARERPVLRVSPNLHRWENGVLTTISGDELLNPASGGDTTNLSGRDRDRVFVVGNQAIFFWEIDSANEHNFGTVHLVHRIQVEAGKAKCGDHLSPCITEIETIWCRSPKEHEETMPHEKDPNFKGTYACTRGG